MNIKYQLEIDNASSDQIEMADQFQKEIEIGMNLYYDLWTLLFDTYNDYENIKTLCLKINKYNENLSEHFNIMMKFNSKNQNLILLYDQYLTNYVNDRNYAKYLTERFTYF